MPDYRESSHALEVARVVEELERIVAARSVAPAAADSARRSKPLVVGPRHTGRRLGALLVTRGYIMEDELERALAVQERTGERLGEVLLRLNFIAERDLTELLAEQFRMPMIDLRRVRIEPSVEGLLSVDEVRSLAALPIRRVDGFVEVAIADPADDATIEFLAERIGGRIRLFLTSRTAIDSALGRYLASLTLCPGVSRGSS